MARAIWIDRWNGRRASEVAGNPARARLARLPGRAATGAARRAFPAAVAVSLLLGGCGDPKSGSQTGSTAAPSTGAVAAKYELPFVTEGAEVTLLVEAVTDGRRVRVTTQLTQPPYPSEEKGFEVFDGERLYAYRPGWEESHVVYEEPSEHPDEFAFTELFLMRPEDGILARLCGDPVALTETRTILERDAVGYRCAAKSFVTEEFFDADEVWFDQATGLLVEAGRLRATRLTPDPKMDEDQFSTEPPDGADVTVYPAKESTYGQKAPGFELHLDEGGDTVRLSDYSGKPVVLVPFSSDLYFGPGYECPDCFPSLVTLLEMTDGGTNPTVLAIQSGPVVREGRPPAPPGVTLTLLDDPKITIQEKYGLSMGHHMAFVFIDGQGLIRHVIDHEATREDFQAGLKSIG